MSRDEIFVYVDKMTISVQQNIITILQVTVQVK